MAINFLDNLDLNDNQLLNARLQNLASDPTSANAGDIIFNTTSGKLKYYDGTSPFSAAGWIDPSAGSYTDWRYQADSGFAQIVQTGNTVDFSGGTGINTTAGTGTLSIALDDISGVVGSYTLANITVDAQGRITSAASGTAGGMTDWDITVNGVSDTVTNGQAVSLSNVTSSGESIDFTRSSARTYLVGAKYTAGSSNGGSGTANIITAAGAGSSWGGSGLFLATNNSSSGAASGAAQKWSIGGFPITRWGTPDANLNMNNHQIINVVDPTAAQDAATKNYVDTNIVGNLVFQGGYNANTNSPNLDNNPNPNNIKKGWAYVVTAAGSFFTETVEVGDFLIAQQDAPTTLANWVTVQNNIGLATNLTPGIASFRITDFDVSAAGEVTLKNTGVTAATYGSVTTVPRIAINAKGQITAAVSQTIAIPHTAVTDFDTEVDARITAREFTATNSGSGTSHIFTHSLNTNNVMVQIVDTSTLETVFAKVDRTSVSAVTVTTASSISAGAIRALITKIG